MASSFSAHLELDYLLFPKSLHANKLEELTDRYSAAAMMRKWTVIAMGLH